MLPQNVRWIEPAEKKEVVIYRRCFTVSREVRHAELLLTCTGIYEARLNGKPVSQDYFCPGWTEYQSRIQVQSYDVTALLERTNELIVTVAEGWYARSFRAQWLKSLVAEGEGKSLWCCLRMALGDGTTLTLSTDESWQASGSPVREASIFDGEVYDANFSPSWGNAVCCKGPAGKLIPQEGEMVREQETLYPANVFTTPKGEQVIDFGQNLTGVMAFTLTAKAGERLAFSCAEVMDQEGNFYTDNYRDAKSRLVYVCREGEQSFRPKHTYFGFRYLRVDEAPEGFDPWQVQGVVLYSQMDRTGYLSSSDPMLNKLFSNIVWGQKGNFLEVPTDCPQRDERLGWTGDIQVFSRAGCFLFDAERFMTKWLKDLALAQKENGAVSDVVPDVMISPRYSAAWGDAATICPMEVYRAYGNRQVLENQFDSMCRWVDFITKTTKTPDLWVGGNHYGDWLGLDAPEGSYVGSTDPDLIGSAFYARSAALVVEAGQILGKDVSRYEELLERIKTAFRKTYGGKLTTQTAKVLALHFGLAEKPEKVAAELAKQVKKCGKQLQTGFVGTPYLLHALSDNGYGELAYTLLLRKDYPSWLYPVTKGATTVWEHWDGIRQDGTFWSRDMNSFNHYAYGSVADWVFSKACGIQAALPGYERVRIAPIPDSRLESLQAELKTRHGWIRSRWVHTEGRVRYEIETPVATELVIDGVSRMVEPGRYVLYGNNG